MNADEAAGSETIDSRYAAALLKLVTDRGYAVERVLAFSELGFNPLEERQGRLSAEQYSRLYQQVLELLQDESFGVSTKRMVTPGAFRMMCYAIIHCDNLGSALYRASDFFRIFFDVAVQLSVQIENSEAVVGYSSVSEVEARRPTTQMEGYALAMWHRFCIWLVGRPLALQLVRLQGDEPAQRGLEGLFNCPVHYAQSSTEMVFDAACLSWSLVQTEQSLKDFLRTAPYRLMATSLVEPESSLVLQVRTMLGGDFSRGFPSFEQIAGDLNMSAPTLRRRLKREGVTYRALKDKCRRDAAIVYLNRPDLSIGAVAALMGFTEPSAFHRSFKKWTGIPPGEFRRQLSEPDFDSMTFR